jgi:hypothetical protein
MEDLAEHEEQVARISVDRGSEQYKQVRLASEVENRDKNLHYFTQLVKQMAVRDFNWYVGPVWTKLPGHGVITSSGSGDFTTGLWTRSVGKVVPTKPFPVRKALTPAEYRQMYPKKK